MSKITKSTRHFKSSNRHPIEKRLGNENIRPDNYIVQVSEISVHWINSQIKVLKILHTNLFFYNTQ
jgi:hypothetical protein